MLRSLHDRELAALAVNGDHAAFGELARRHASSVRTLLRRMGAQPALADDVAQDALLIGFERIASFRNEGSFGAWIKQIAARLYVKRWRADAKLDQLDDRDGLEAMPDSGMTSGDKIDLDKALRSLSYAERVCVSLCHGAGFSHAEIAKELKLPLGTVKSHVKRGLDKLKAHLVTQRIGEQ